MKHLLRFVLFSLALAGPALFGAAVPYSNAALSGTAVSVKVAPTTPYAAYLQVLHYNVSNTNSTPVYVQFFDALVANVTPGTTAPTFFLSVPANGVLDGEFPVPPAFSTALVICVTTTPAGATAPGTAVPITLHYE